MLYFVTFGGVRADGKPGPIGIDEPLSQRPFELVDALAHACRLVGEGKQEVTINDGKGGSISGEDLLACCRDEKILPADLRATS